MARMGWRLLLSRDKAGSGQLHAREEGATGGKHWGSREVLIARGSRCVTLLTLLL